MKNELEIISPQVVQNTGNIGLVSDIRSIVDDGLKKAYQLVDAVMVDTYWHVGRRIVEQEQNGKAVPNMALDVLKC